MTSVWVQSIHGQAVPHRSILYFNTMEIDKWVIEPEAKCLFCADKTSPDTVHEHKENVAEDGQQKSSEKSEHSDDHMQGVVEGEEQKHQNEEIRDIVEVVTQLEDAERERPVKE